MEQKWVVLSGDLKKSPTAYYAPRIEPEHLKAADDSGWAVKKEWPESLFGPDRIIAFAALWPTWDPKCREFGTAWVEGNNGGKGLMRSMMAELIGRVSADTNLFFITKDPAVMHLGMQYGFVRVSGTTHPNILEWASRRGLTCRIPTSVHAMGWPPHKEEERWLFMRHARGARGR